MSSAISFNLDLPKILSSGNGLNRQGHIMALYKCLLALAHQCRQNLSIQCHCLLFRYASEVSVEKSPKRKCATTGFRASNLQVTIQIRYLSGCPAGFLELRECLGIVNL